MVVIVPALDFTAVVFFSVALFGGLAEGFDQCG